MKTTTSVPGVTAPSQFLKTIKAVSPRHRAFENFCNFVEAAYCSYAKPMARSERDAGALEKRYMNVVAHYRDEPLAMHRMSEALAELFLCVPSHHGDFLGETYMLGDFNNKHLDQFFTPYEICKLQAAMTIGSGNDLERIVAERGYVRILDPACGSGGQIIAAADYIRSRGLDPHRNMFATLIDIDPLCMAMSFLQMTFLDIPAVVLLGNSIKQEYREIAYTAAGLKVLSNEPVPTAETETSATNGVVLREPKATIVEAPRSTAKEERPATARVREPAPVFEQQSLF